MDFETFIDNIKLFFINNLPDYISEINDTKTDLVFPNPDKYEIDFPDNFQNSEAIVFYILPWDYNISPLTNESDDFISNIKIIVVFRKDSNTNLYKISHRYMEAIYNLLNEKNTLDNNTNYTEVNGIHYESEIERSMKAIEINITTHTEI